MSALQEIYELSREKAGADRRFQLARDLMVAHVGRHGIFSTPSIAGESLELADDLLARLAKPAQEGGEE